MTFRPTGNRRFWGSGRPRAAGNLPKRWGASPPTFLEGITAARGPPRPPKINDFRSVKKSYIKNPVVKAGKPSKKVGGEASYLFGRYPGRPGAAQTPKIDDFRSVKKSYIKNSCEIALELVSGADFLCKLMCGAGPVDLRGSPAAPGPPRPPKSTISGRSKNHILKKPAKWP